VSAGPPPGPAHGDDHRRRRRAARHDRRLLRLRLPALRRAWQVLDHLLEDYGDDLRVVFRSLTVPGFADGERPPRPRSRPGPRASSGRCTAGCSRARASTARRLKAHAEALGLDVPRFLDDLDLGAFSGPRDPAPPRGDRARGSTSARSRWSTADPVVGFRDEAAWHDLLDEEILAARARCARAAPRGDLYAAFQAEAVPRPSSSSEAARGARKQLAGRFAVDLKKLPADFKRAETGAPLPGRPRRRRAGGRPRRRPRQIVAFMDFECPYCRRAAEEGFAALRRRATRTTCGSAFATCRSRPTAAPTGPPRAAVAADRRASSGRSPTSCSRTRRGAWAATPSSRSPAPRARRGPLPRRPRRAGRRRGDPRGHAPRPPARPRRHAGDSSSTAAAQRLSRRRDARRRGRRRARVHRRTHQVEGTPRAELAAPCWPGACPRTNSRTQI
jgi:hypothetical protein